jgi:hypothetical protein
VGSCVLGAACALLAPSARAADVPISEQARTHFAAGVALLQDPKAPRYEEAYREFKAAYAASPSYKILGNLGLCAMKIERDEEAIVAYETYLVQAGPDLGEQERQQIDRDLLTLKSGIVRVTVSSDPPGATLVDVRTPVQGPEIRNVYTELSGPTPLALRRGHHTITAKLAGYLDQTWDFDSAEAQPPPHVFVMTKPLAPAPTLVRERPIPTTAWVTGAVAAALGVGSAVVGAFAISKHNQYEVDNSGLSESRARDDRSAGMLLNSVTDGLLIGTVVSAGLAVYFVATRPVVERPLLGAAPKRPSLVPIRVSPTWSVGSAHGAGHGGNSGGPGISATWAF